MQVTSLMSAKDQIALVAGEGRIEMCEAPLVCPGKSKDHVPQDFMVWFPRGRSLQQNFVAIHRNITPQIVATFDSLFQDKVRYNSNSIEDELLVSIRSDNDFFFVECSCWFHIGGNVVR